MFFVDHQALLYLVNKPSDYGRIVRWFVLLLEFDFTVTVRKGSTHVRADHLSRLTSGEPPEGVNDDMPDAALFKLDIIPRWSEPIARFLSMGIFDDDDTLSKQEIVRMSAPYTLISGSLYRKGGDGILRLCLGPEEYSDILHQVHIDVID